MSTGTEGNRGTRTCRPGGEERSMGARPEHKEAHGEQDPEQSRFKSGPSIHSQGAGVCWGKEALSLEKTNGQHLL